jgi:hypothetical protein
MKSYKAPDISGLENEFSGFILGPVLGLLPAGPAHHAAFRGISKIPELQKTFPVLKGFLGQSSFS